jgi:hypothetical protein
MNGVHRGALALVSTDRGGGKAAHSQGKRIAQTNRWHSREVESGDDELIDSDA